MGVLHWFKENDDIVIFFKDKSFILFLNLHLERLSSNDYSMILCKLLLIEACTLQTIEAVWNFLVLLL